MNPNLAAVLDQFASAMADAQRARTILKKRYGLTDRQIGEITLRPPGGQHHDRTHQT